MLKQTLSIFALTAQCTWKKLLLILLLILTGEGVVLMLFPVFKQNIPLEQLIASIPYTVPMILGIIAYFAVLINHTKQKKIRQLVSRLPVPPASIGVAWTTYNFIALVILWAALLCISYLWCNVYFAIHGNENPLHITTLAFFSNEILRWLLPLEGLLPFIKRGLLLAAIALILTGWTIPTFRKKFGTFALLVCFILLIIYAMLSKREIYLIFFGAALAVFCILSIYAIAKGKFYEEDDAEDEKEA